MWCCQLQQVPVTAKAWKQLWCHVLRCCVDVVLSVTTSTYDCYGMETAVVSCVMV